MICTNCGATNPDNSKFCTNCGAPIQAEATPAAPEANVPPADPAAAYNQPVQGQQPMQQPYGAPQQQGYQQQSYGAQPMPAYQQPYGAPNPEPPKKVPIVPIVIAVVAVVVVAGIIIAGALTNWFGLAPASSGTASSSASSAVSTSSSASTDPTAAWAGSYKVTGGSALATSADGKQKLYLAEDGKAALDISGNVTMGTWKADDGETGTLTMNNSDFDLTLDGEDVTVTNSKGQTLVFSKTSSSTDSMPSASSTSPSSSSASPSASSSAASSPFVGNWKLTSMTSNGQTLNQQEIDSTGVTITLNIKADGTFVYGANGQNMSGTWKADSNTKVTLTVSGSPLVFELKDAKTLVTNDQGTSMTFTKQ